MTKPKDIITLRLERDKLKIKQEKLDLAIALLENAHPEPIVLFGRTLEKCKDGETFVYRGKIQDNETIIIARSPRSGSLEWELEARNEYVLCIAKALTFEEAQRKLEQQVKDKAEAAQRTLNFAHNLAQAPQ
jgi:hypothetical protein